MANFIVVQLLVLLLLSATAFAKVDRLFSEVYLGEKKLDAYAERYHPLIFQDIYQGKLVFEDELFFQNYFRPYSFSKEREISFFLRSELSGGLSCTNENFSEHYDDIRYSYRLITLSYLLEGQWQMKLLSEHFKLNNGCGFELQKWLKGCNPESPSMKKFISQLKKFNPKYDEVHPHTYRKADWWKELKSGKFKSYPHYKTHFECKGRCIQEDMPQKFKLICDNNQKLMDLICSEKDHLYGLSTYRDAYALLGQSNIINTYNKRGEAIGCLRRFSEVMSHKEVPYPPLQHLFPVLQTDLREKYEERFLQGRVFFYGSSKEFVEKGLSDLHVKDQTMQIAVNSQKEPDQPILKKKVEVTRPIEKKATPVEVAALPKKKEIQEIRVPNKSAFLQAAEIRLSQNLPRVEVDMLKLKYDYVFTLNMMNTLSERLKVFMTREALTEMATYDKLGSKSGPIPLLFLKFMIDMQEHQGLWNLISVLGDKFYVSNEIDANFKPEVEHIQLVNNESSGRQWQFYILRP